MIILINSCHRDRADGRQAVNKETWLSKWKVPYKFVIGGGEAACGDELIVDTEDGYQYMPDKHKAGFQWALDHGHDYAVQTCTDTYVHVPRLFLSNYGAHDYIGYACEEGHASGGAGFCLNRRAMQAIVKAPIGGTGYGDLWVGQQLAKAGIKLHQDHRYWPHSDQTPPISFITAHLSRGTGNFDPQWMRDLHRSQ